ncbi:hypothetical protein Q4I28_002675, partial [Leishmania naiffi]
YHVSFDYAPSHGIV